MPLEGGGVLPLLPVLPPSAFFTAASKRLFTVDMIVSTYNEDRLTAENAPYAQLSSHIMTPPKDEYFALVAAKIGLSPLTSR